MGAKTVTYILTATLIVLGEWATADNPWADEVIDYSPIDPRPGFDDPTMALGPPQGWGPTVPNNDRVVSLGRAGGSITLKFNTPVRDDPENPMGLDFIVYSNAFWVAGNPQRKFQEPGIVEISPDGETWYLIPGSRGFDYNPFPRIEEPAGQFNDREGDSPYYLAGNIRNPNSMDGDPETDDIEYNWGYVDMSPTMMPYLDNYLRPDNPFEVGMTPRSGGGDAFDIAWAVDADGNPANLAEFNYIRITALVDRHMQALGWATTEVMAVADVARDIDTSGDGILDDYEIRVAGTDPLRRENTVLPLEIPAIEGGSPPGTLLGTAEDERGTRLRLYAGEQRTAADRRFNCIVDILAPEAPAGDLPGDLLLSETVREIQASEPDFIVAGIEAAEITLNYTSTEIAGLDEAALEPFRYDGNGGYTQVGISNVQRNAPANRVTFRTRYPGVFVLASGPGTGDADADGPRGTIILSADPTSESLVGSEHAVSVVSGVILDQDDDPVADGTLITVATTRGTIDAADADPNRAGIQVPTTDGTVAFTLSAPTQAGSALITATSVEGSAYGELDYTFLPVPPVAPIEWNLGAPEGSEPYTIRLTSTILRDAYGNIVRDGTLITVVVHAATIASGDADIQAPGHQVQVNGGRAELFIEVDTLDAPIAIDTYADAEQTISLGSDAYTPEEPAALPLSGVCWTVPALIGAFLLVLRRRKIQEVLW